MQCGRYSLCVGGSCASVLGSSARHATRAVLTFDRISYDVFYGYGTLGTRGWTGRTAGLHLAHACHQRRLGTCTGGGEVQIAPPSVTGRVGERQSVFATAYDSRGNVIPGVPLRWSSTNLAVLRVVPDSTAPDLATLVGIAPGVAQVEVRAADRKGSATVQVAAAGAGAPGAPPVRMPAARGGAASHLQIDPNTVYLLPAEGRRLNPIFLMADGTPASPAPVTWRSMIPSVASVNAQGVVVGLGAGQGLIEASAPGGLSARVPVQVALSRFTLDQSAVAMSPGTFDSLHVVVPEQNNRRVAPEAPRTVIKKSSWSTPMVPTPWPSP